MVIEYIYCLLYEIFLAKTISRLRKVKLSKHLKVVLILSVINFLMTYLLGFHIDKYVTYDIPILNILLSLLLISLESYLNNDYQKDKLINIMFITTTFFCIYGFVSLIVSTFLLSYLKIPIVNIYSVGITRTIIVLSILFMSYIIIQRIFSWIEMEHLLIPNKYLKIYIVLLVVVISIVTLFSSLIIYNSSLLMYLSFFLIVMFFIIAMKLLTDMNDLYLEKENERIQAEINKVVVQNIEKDIENNQEMKKFRHDINNKLLALKYLNDVKSQELLKNIEEDFSKFNPVVDSGNSYIDAIINSKYSRYKDIIHFEWKVMASDNNQMRTSDLCSILYNILDNAVEETIRIQKDSINVFIKYTKDELIIKVINPTELTQQDFPLSTKKDSQYHGHGLAILKKIIDSYNGIYENNIIDGYYHCYVYIAF